MRTDPKAARTLAQLARLQGLRVAKRALALDDAREAREAASAHAGEVQQSLRREEAELADLLAAGRFDPVLFAMKGALVVDHARALDAAHSETDAALSTERERQRDWQASRYQRDWLTARQREAERKLRHKQDDKAAVEALGLAALRTEGGHA